MDNKGISFVETLLVVVILFVLTGSLIPLSTKLSETLFEKKLDLHVSQVAFSAAKQIVNLGTYVGTEMIENTKYQWFYDGQKLCVNYQLFKEDEIKCFTQEGII